MHGCVLCRCLLCTIIMLYLNLQKKLIIQVYQCCIHVHNIIYAQALIGFHNDSVACVLYIVYTTIIYWVLNVWFNDCVLYMY